MMQYATLEETVYLWFVVNDTTGAGADGSSPAFDVRHAGAASGAAPVLSGTPTLLTHANYADGAYEVAVAATAANGFAAGNSYGVFCNATVSAVNPTGFVGGFKLGGIPWNAAWDAEVQSEADDALRAMNLQYLLKETVPGNVYSDAMNIRSVIGYMTESDETPGFSRVSSLEGMRDQAFTNFAAILVDTTQIKGDLPARITRNVALANFGFRMSLSTDHVSAATGKTVTAQRSLDGAAFAPCANTVAEIGSGFYKINLAATDTDALVVHYLFTASGADDVPLTVVTEPT